MLYLKNITLDEYLKLNDKIKTCKNYIEKNDLQKIELGRHEIIEDELYANVMEYDTKASEDLIWEAHREYFDLHYIVRGSEYIEISDINNMSIGIYEKEKDYVHIDGNTEFKIKMSEGDMLLLDVSEAHKTEINVNNHETVRKLVFKIKRF